ncbi:MAG: hypothetical protein QOH72_49 [Solirubrobacteraceae bacterium]|nr:hypothetical protein [Solirubrobacteraceae bacterium]
MSDALLLAVDGGNTKTLAVVATPDGRVAGTGRGGCSDIYNAASPAAALDAVGVAVRGALAEAGAGCDAVVAAAFSLAGADWPEDFALLERELPERLGLRDTPTVVNDALGALRSGSSERWEGVAVVSGTYNAVGARRADGSVFHLGFWPDGAGARNLADEALKAVYRAELELGPATSLTALALDLYGVADPIALLHEFTCRGGLQEGDQDRLAPLVLDAADAGDAVARDIVVGKGRVLGGQARACAQRAGLALDGTLVVMTGGVMRHPSDLLAGAVMAELPGAEAVRPAAPPVIGALLLAFDRLGVAADSGALAAGLDFDARSPGWLGSPSTA